MNKLFAITACMVLSACGAVTKAGHDHGLSETSETSYPGTRQIIKCVNPATGAELKILGHSTQPLANLTLNSELANHFMDKGIANAYAFTGLGQIDWDNWTFSETSPWGKTAYFRADRDGHRFIFISQQYVVIADFLFNHNECRLIRP